jgi:hypothetical protein
MKCLKERSFRRHRRICEDDIKTDFREIVLEGVDWIYLAQGKDQWWALVDSVMNVHVPWTV